MIFREPFEFMAYFLNFAGGIKPIAIILELRSDVSG